MGDSTLFGGLVAKSRYQHNDTTFVMCIVWIIRIVVPFLAGALILRFYHPTGVHEKEKISDVKRRPRSSRPISPPRLLLNTLISTFRRLVHGRANLSGSCYSVQDIVRYRQSAVKLIPKSRPKECPHLVPCPRSRPISGRRHSDRISENSSLHNATTDPHGLLGVPNIQPGPHHHATQQSEHNHTHRPWTSNVVKTFQNNRSLRQDSGEPWLPSADVSQLGMHTVSNDLSDSVLSSGMISAAAYQQMLSARRAFTNNGATGADTILSRSPVQTTSKPPQRLSLQEALETAESAQQHSGARQFRNDSALRTVTPVTQRQAGKSLIFDSPALQHLAPHHFNQPRRVSGETTEKRGNPAEKHVPNRPSSSASGNPMGGAKQPTTIPIQPQPTVEPCSSAPDGGDSTPSFITANRDAVIELRKLLCSPDVHRAKSVRERLISQNMQIAPQTYTLLVTVAILSGESIFAKQCAAEMSAAGFNLSASLQQKLNDMHAAAKAASPETGASAQQDKRDSQVQEKQAIRNCPAGETKTKLTASAPVFTPSQMYSPSTTAATVRPHAQYIRQHPNAPPAAPAWLMPGKLAYASASQHATLRPTAGEFSPPLPDSSPPPSSLLPGRSPRSEGSPYAHQEGVASASSTSSPSR